MSRCCTQQSRENIQRRTIKREVCNWFVKHLGLYIKHFGFQIFLLLSFCGLYIHGASSVVRRGGWPVLGMAQQYVWSSGSTESLMCWERWGERMYQSDLEKPAGDGGRAARRVRCTAKDDQQKEGREGLALFLTLSLFRWILPFPLSWPSLSIAYQWSFERHAS